MPGDKGMRHFEILLRLNAKGVASKIFEIIGDIAKRINADGVRNMPNQRGTAAATPQLQSSIYLNHSRGLE